MHSMYLKPKRRERQEIVRMPGASFGSTCLSLTSAKSPSALVGMWKQGTALMQPMMNPPPVIHATQMASPFHGLSYTACSRLSL